MIPSINMLPMEEIRKELSKDFASKNEVSIDTLNVGEVESSRIAVTYDAEDETIEEGVFPPRETVRNSIYLAGLPASSYVQKKDLTSESELAEKLRVQSLREFAQTRDELYQLYQALIKNGLLQDITLFSGFQDHFSKDSIKYLSDNDQKLVYFNASDAMDSTSNINKIILNASGFINEGEFFTIKISNYAEQREIVVSEKVYKAVNVVVENGCDTFNFCEISTGIDTAISALNANEILSIGKIRGTYKNKTFSFTDTITVAATTPRSTSILDYDSASDKTISSPYSGYATSIRVKEELIGFKESGYLQSLSVVGYKQGAPGSLRIYVIKSTDLSKITDIQNIESNHSDLIVAKSNVISSNTITSKAQFIVFNFNTDDGKYPILEKDQTYVFLITALGNVDEYNSWKIRFGAGANNTDLHTNRTAYTFNNATPFICPFNGDILCYLTMYEKLDEEEVNFTNGLYTSKDFTLTEKRKYARARVSLRTLKEATFFSQNLSANLYDVGKLFEVSNPNFITNLRSGDKVVIDCKIRTIKEVVSGEVLRISLTEPIVLGAHSMIYKANNSVNLKLKKYQTSKDISLLNTLIVPLTLMQVNKHSENAEVTDTLIYEADIPNTFSDLDAANIQVAWFTDLPNAYGRIHDLSVLFIEGV